MSSKTKKVDQESLRKMMKEMKATKRPANSSDKLKKYKLSKKEHMLIEEQKRLESKRNTDSRSIPKGFFEAKPVKSILKNSSSQSPIPTSSSKISKDNNTNTMPISSKISTDNTSVERSEETRILSEKDLKQTKEESAKGSSDLPEGFFDDPIQDAKARQVEYKDPAEVEWEKFQKEISIELSSARDIEAEEQIEATNDRQLDEIEDQMNAWNRVIKLEKERDKIEEDLKLQKEKLKESKTKCKTEDSDDEEENFDEFMDWRNKC